MFRISGNIPAESCFCCICPRCCSAFQLLVGKHHLLADKHSLCCIPSDLQISWDEGHWSTWKAPFGFDKYLFGPVAESWFSKSYREVSSRWALHLYQGHVSGFETNAFTLCREKDETLFFRLIAQIMWKRKEKRITWCDYLAKAGEICE